MKFIKESGKYKKIIWVVCSHAIKWIDNKCHIRGQNIILKLKYSDNAKIYNKLNKL